MAEMNVLNGADALELSLDQPQAQPAQADVPVGVADAPPAAPQQPQAPQQSPQEDWQSKYNAIAQERDSWQKQTAPADPFANDLVKKVNDLVSGGASVQEVSRFIEMQSIDTKSLSDIEAVRLHTSMKHPNLNPEEVDAIIGIDPDDKSAGSSAKLKVAAVAARQEIEREKVNLEPKTQIAKNADAIEGQQDIALLEQKWSSITQKFIQTAPPSVAVKEAFDFGNYESKIEFDDLARKNIAETAKTILVAAKAGFTQENLAQAMQMATAQEIGMNAQKYIGGIVKQCASEIWTAAMKSVSGPPPNSVSTGPIKPVQSQGKNLPPLELLLQN